MIFKAENPNSKREEKPRQRRKKNRWILQMIFLTAWPRKLYSKTSDKIFTWPHVTFLSLPLFFSYVFTILSRFPFLVLTTFRIWCYSSFLSFTRLREKAGNSRIFCKTKNANYNFTFPSQMWPHVLHNKIRISPMMKKITW